MRLENIKILIERVKQKDNAAFELLYNETKYSVFSIIYAIVQDTGHAEDLMQETYIKMLRSIDTFNPKYKFKTWLLTIAKHLAIDFYRKNKQTVNIDIHTQEYLIPPHHDHTMKKMESEMFLSILTEEERIIVMLKIIDGMKHREIGKLLNKPQGTIMWVYQKAIKKMQAYGKEE